MGVGRKSQSQEGVGTPDVDFAFLIANLKSTEVNMKIDKKLIEKAMILEGKAKPVEWAADFSTVEEMLRLGIGWKTIQTVLGEKYQKTFTINGLIRSYNKFHPKNISAETAVPGVPKVLLPDQNSTE